MKSLTSQVAAQNEIETHQFTLHFLKAFENLDMPTFIAWFAEDANAFFPSPEPPLRFIGKPAIQTQFEVVFAGIRNHASASRGAR